MSLNVDRIQNNNFYGDRNKVKRQENQSFTSSEFAKSQMNKSNDGKFSTSEAAKNFAKGLISPLTAMFSSTKAFLAGAGLIVGSLALVAATGGAAAPILVAAGVGMGALQAGKAAVKIATAKNGDDVEKAFYDVGGATSTIGLSLWGAKGSLKQAGIATDEISVLGATKKCFTSLKDLGVESFNVFKSGYYKTNLSNAMKVIKNPSSLKKYAKDLSKEGTENYEASFNTLKEALPEEFRPYLEGRNKCEISIYEKMVRDMTKTIDNEIAKVNKNPRLSELEKNQQIKELLAQRQRMKTDPDFAKSKVEDLYGARLNLDDISPENIQKLFVFFEKASKKGPIKILEVENYRGFNEKYQGANEYIFTEDQMNGFRQMAPKANIMNKTKPSGYTAANVKIQLENGKVMELQIGGSEVGKVYKAEHFLYDFKSGKDIAKGNNQSGILLSKYKKAIEKMSPELYEKYQEYYYEKYVHAQAKELSKPSVEPILPEGIDPMLSFESLENLNAQVEKFPPRGIKNPFDIHSQATFIAGMEGLFNPEYT